MRSAQRLSRGRRFRQAPRQIVCGAKNYKVGDKVALALPARCCGDFKIKAASFAAKRAKA